MTYKTILHPTGGHTHFFEVPQEFGDQLKEIGFLRVICEINYNEPIHVALRKGSDGGWLVMLGKDKMKRLKLSANKEITVNIRQDDSKYGMAFPEELEAVLDTDPEAKILFEELSDGKKRTILHYVGSAKISDTRIGRSLKICDNLKLGIKDPRKLLK